MNVRFTIRVYHFLCQGQKNQNYCQIFRFTTDNRGGCATKKMTVTKKTCQLAAGFFGWLNKQLPIFWVLLALAWLELVYWLERARSWWRPCLCLGCRFG